MSSKLGILPSTLCRKDWSLLDRSRHRIRTLCEFMGPSPIVSNGESVSLEDHRKPYLRLVNIQVDVRPTAQLVRRTEMHHFRGKLFQGDKLCLDPANVYIDRSEEHTSE